MTAVMDSYPTHPLPASAGGERAGVMASARVTMKVVSEQAWDDIVADFDGVCQEQLAIFARLRWPDVRM